MIEVMALLLVLIGSFLQMLSAFGLLTLPGLLGRLHGASKASTLGLMCVLVAAFIERPGGESAVKSLALILFVFITSPLVAQVFASIFLQNNPEEISKLKKSSINKGIPS